MTNGDRLIAAIWFIVLCIMISVNSCNTNSHITSKIEELKLRSKCF